VAEDFDKLGLSPRVRDAVHALGWRRPTPIQEAAVPLLLRGRDVLGHAPTGSGKTGAFGLVLSERMQAPGIRALVLVPTRELCLQITRDLNALSQAGPLKAASVYGGVPFEPQLASIADPAVTCLVATPGRLIEFLGMRRVRLDRVEILVVDEADRMLDLGFLPDVESLIRSVPARVQMALFSATFPRKVLALTRRYMPAAKMLSPQSDAMPGGLVHATIEVPSSLRREALLALLKKEEPGSCLVFVRKRAGADDLARWLVGQGVDAAPIHGDLAQAAREGTLAQFRDGALRFLVATDVAARGLDIPAVTHVVNFEIPEDAEAYIHRAGRTARAGRGGKVVTLVSEQDRGRFASLRRGVPVRFASETLPGFVQRAAPDRAKPEGVHAPPPRATDKKRLNPKWVDRKRR
jgi:superfamily II DNA/RNA helicase